MFHKMYTSLSPPYLSALLPATVGANVSYNLRNPNNLQTVQCYSQLYYNSFLPSAIRTWNGLPEDTRNINSAASLKFQLNNNLNPPPRYYNEGKRLAHILHSRLRTNCSSLNQHLYSKNIVQSSLCACGGIEDTGHFLFHCPLYHNYRQDMLRSVSRLCQHSLLYGNDNLSVSDNKQIFIIVQDFIVKTKRFQVNH